MTAKKKPNANHTEETMRILSAEVFNLLLKSRDLKRKGRPEESDFIDEDVIDSVARINVNPLLVTTGSCSGHDGHPFLSVVFKDEKSRNYYCRKVRAAGASAIKSNDFRLDYFTGQEPTLAVKEEWNFGFRSECSKAAAKKFWKTLVEIFETLPRDMSWPEFDLDGK